MARKQDGAAAAGKAAPDGSQTSVAARTQPRQRRRQQQGGQQGPRAAAAAAAAEPFEDPVSGMPWYSYYPRQYGGLSLGALACGSTVACYDQLDPLRAWKLVGALALALAALAIHELRPFKRMNYGDKAREQGMGVGAMMGL